MTASGSGVRHVNDMVHHLELVECNTNLVAKDTDVG